VSRLQQGVAIDANQREVVEVSELLRHATQAKEQCLAVRAPALQVTGIQGDLDESNSALMNLEVMSANDRGRPLAMTAALDVHTHTGFCPPNVYAAQPRAAFGAFV
jgi:hypothetical protein